MLLSLVSLVTAGRCDDVDDRDDDGGDVGVLVLSIVNEDDDRCLSPPCVVNLFRKEGTLEKASVVVVIVVVIVVIIVVNRRIRATFLRVAVILAEERDRCRGFVEVFIIAE